jgi:CubicO group peptidase (beta-lactamase class C family)
VRHLLAHASGLPFEDEAPLAPPGTRRIYSNAGFEAVAETVAAHAGMRFDEYLAEGVLGPLGMASTHLVGSPAAGAEGPLCDLLALAGELLHPRLLSAGTVALATTVAFADLDGVLPGFGQQKPNDWGLGVEVHGAKHPHWMAATASPRTFGHFGQAGGFIWVDPDAAVALASLSDRDFGPWARAAWPALGTAVLAEAGEE